VQDKIDRDLGMGQLDRAQHLFRVLDVDVAGERQTEERKGLLPVDKGDHPVAAPLLEEAERPYPANEEDALW
jgi:hypothetical protein